MSFVWSVGQDFFLTYFIYSNAISLLLLILAYFSVRHLSRLRPLFASFKYESSAMAPPISIIAPAYNEAHSIKEAVKSFLMLHYPKFEIIVVNDGSTDQTLRRLQEAYQLEPVKLFYDGRLSKAKIRGTYRSRLHPELYVIDKVNGGKADAINMGIGFSNYGLFCAVDSDSILDADALGKVVIPFLDDPERTVASGGTIRPANGCKIVHGKVVERGLPRSFLGLLQVVEYLRAFLFGRVGWNAIQSTMIISGAFGIFKKSAVIEVGGYRHQSLGEDMELVVRLRRYFMEQKRAINISFIPDPICWTEVPSKWKILRRQRARWQKGLAECLMLHFKVFLNPRFGFTGILSFPYFFLVELCGPAIEMLAYAFILMGLGLGKISLDFLILILVVDILFGTLMSFGSVLIEENSFHLYPKLSDVLKLLGVSLLEHLGYRQFNSLVRAAGLVEYFLGDRSWGRMPKAGFSSRTS